MLVTRHEHLAELAAAWAESPWLAVDTEFVREDTYYPQLCLIQISDGVNSACVDALALEDLAPLFELLERTDRLKVLHAASQDLEIFVRLRGRTPQPLFDTQVAAALLGLGDQLGYGALVEQRLGVKLDKSLVRTNWAQRPLSAAALAYAEADVLHLAQLYPALREALARRGRLRWLEEDCARLAEAQRYRPRPALEWRRLRGLARLSPVAQHLAAALAQWRETVAEARNRPRKWILSDELLHLLAERRPETAQQLKSLGVPAKSIERHGEALLALIRETPPADAAPLVRDERLSPPQKRLLQQLQQALRELAADVDLPPAMIAARADLEALLLQGEAAETPLLQGWRRELAGERLLALLP